MKPQNFLVLLTAMSGILSLGMLSTSYAEDASVPSNPVEALIWSQEHKIYDGRAHGTVQYYIDHTSPNYLAWPPVVDRPINNDGLKKGRQVVAGGHEMIKSELTGFTQDGDTAIIYYLNHRTMRADGTPVDEQFANIHVWIKRGDSWVLLGGMSRLLPGAKSK